MNPIIQTLMSSLKNKNPNGYNMINQLINNGGNPEQVLKQIMGNISPEQRQQILNQAKSYGTPNDILSRIQNMK